MEISTQEAHQLAREFIRSHNEWVKRNGGITIPTLSKLLARNKK